MLGASVQGVAGRDRASRLGSRLVDLSPQAWAVVAVAYLAAAVASNAAASHFAEAQHVLVWFAPSGLMFASLVLIGWRWAPVALIGRLAGSWAVGSAATHTWRVLASAVLVTVVYTAGAGLMRWLIERGRVPGATEAVIVLLVAGLGVSAISAAGQVTLLSVDLGRVAGGWSTGIWSYFVGNANGILTIAPGLHLLGRRRSPSPTRATLKGGIEVAIELAAVGAIAGYSVAGAGHHLYLIMVPVLVLALRWGLSGASAAVTMASITLAVTAHEQGVSQADLRSVCAFTVVLGAMTLLAGGRELDRRREVGRRQAAFAELGEANAALEATTAAALAGQARYRALLGHLPDSVAFLLDRTHRITMVSRARGRDWGEADLLGKTPEDLLPARQAQLAHQWLDHAFAGEPTTVETAFRPVVPHLLIDVVAVDPLRTGPADEVLVVARDISERKARERALTAAHARFSALVEHSQDVTTIIDPTGELRYVSPAWGVLVGSEPAAALGTSFIDLVHPDDVDDVTRTYLGLLGHPGRVTTSTCRIRTDSGAWRHCEVTVTNHLDDPFIGGLVGNLRDVTERMEAADRLTYLAMHDQLTGLPNRALLLNRLDHALARRKRSGVGCAALFVDLDRFKGVNDSLGHATGDQVLMRVAERLQATARPHDSVARLGGDEFVVVVEDVSSPGEAMEIAERIRRAIAEPVTISGTSLTIGCSIGVAVSARQHAEGLLQEADIAMYRAKQHGRNRSALYDEIMHTQATRRHDIDQLLRRALDHNGIELVYQPIVDLSTGEMVGTEALARLVLPDGTHLGAEQFIPVAEDTGLIVHLGAAVLDAACAQQAAWAGKGNHPRRMSINVSARQLLAASFADEVAAAVSRHGLDPAHLCLELTESALIDAGASTRRTVMDLKALGVSLALDDFGTGWSSLAYLRRFPIDALKIDQSFVSGLGTEPGDTEVVRAVISLGRALELTTIAEGVEDVTQEAELLAMGCEMAQGFRYARPLHPDQVGALCRSVRPFGRIGPPRGTRPGLRVIEGSFGHTRPPP